MTESWQDDIDEHGNSIGICPKCGGEARISWDRAPAGVIPRVYWECSSCGHRGSEIYTGWPLSV